MSLRTNAFVLLLLTTLIAIVGDWSASVRVPWWCLPGAVLLLGLAYERWFATRAGLSVRITVPATLRLGSPAQVRIKLLQRTSRPLALELAPAVPAALDCDASVQSLASGSELMLEIVPQRLGHHTMPAQRARVAGPLGLAWWPVSVVDPVPVDVLPDLLGRNAARTGLDLAGGRRAPRRGHGSELLQLRPYQPGDPLRMIDWKSSARSGSLVARDQIEDQALDVVVALDAGRASRVWCGRLDRLGHYVNLGARLAEAAVAQGDRVGLVVYGDRTLAALAPDRGLGAVRRLRTALANVRSEPSDSNPMQAAQRIRALVHRRCLVILLTEIDDASSDGQLVAAVALLRTVHLPLVVGLRSGAAGAFATTLGGDWRDPYRTLAAAETARAEARSVGALHARGVHALLAPPERLEAEVFAAYAALRRQRRV